MEKVGLSFVIGAVVGASFKTSINGVKTSIGDINREVKQLSKKRAELLDKKWNSSSRFLESDKNELLRINKEIARLKKTETIHLKFRSNINEVKNSLSDLMKFGGVVSAGALIAAKPVSIAVDFEQSMLNIKSVVNGISEQEFNALSKEARRLGAETSFSAREAADGMKYLAMAGFKSNQIIDAMPGLLDMAKAGVIDLGRASDISSNILSAFGLSAQEMTRVADTLTMAFTTSNTTLESLGYTMKHVGPIAREAGMSLEEATAMAGLLGNVGIQGEMAGTQLRAMVNRLTAPVGPAQEKLKELGITVKDSTGNLRPMIELLAEMDEKTAAFGNADRLAAFKTIFGEEAVSGLTELVNQAGAGGISKYLSIVQNSKGKASEVASIQMSGLKGSLDELSSSIEGIAISFGTLMIPAIKTAAQVLTTLTGGINNLLENHKGLVEILKIGTGIVLGFVAGYKSLAFVVGAYKTAVSILTIAQLALNGAMLANPVGLIIGGTAAGVAVYGVVKNWDKIKEYFANLWEGIKQTFFDALEAIKPAINFVGNAAGKLMAVTRVVSESVTWVGNKLGLTEEKADFSANNLTRPAFQLEVAKNNKPVSEHITQKGGAIDKYNKNVVNNAPVNYSPNITIQGNANKQDIIDAEKMSQREFEKMYKQQMHNSARPSPNGAY